MSKKERAFNCPYCKALNKAEHPDDYHPDMKLEHPGNEAQGDVIETIEDCIDCKHPITLYWYRKKRYFGIA